MPSAISVPKRHPPVNQNQVKYINPKGDQATRNALGPNRAKMNGTLGATRARILKCARATEMCVTGSIWKICKEARWLTLSRV